MSCALAGETSTELKGSCARGCITTVCCETTKQGVQHYLCLAQMRKRLGGKPEPGDKCGSCETRFE